MSDTQQIACALVASMWRLDTQLLTYLKQIFIPNSRQCAYRAEEGKQCMPIIASMGLFLLSVYMRIAKQIVSIGP